jgi:serine/threonine-protein kinase
MSASGDEALLAELAARIAAGDTIDPGTLPASLRDSEAGRRLLRFARVAQAFDRNAGMEPGAPGVAAAPTRIGAWRVIRLLGSGGMGDVWLGERADGTVEHRVAIKRVRGGGRAFTERLLAERRILARLSHPNIARFIDAGVDEHGAPWLALEYVDGRPLGDWLAAAKPGLAARLRLFRRICAAVEHAHRHLVVHRDLKPGNVLVDAAGEPRLLDFGVAKLLDGDHAETTTAALTPAYAAPEQLRGGEISTATDVYALGLLLFRMLTGELPETRTGGNVADLLRRLDDEETQRPSHALRRAAEPLPYGAAQLEGDLDAIVSLALRGAPEARYGSVAALGEDVERFLESRPVRARAPTRWYLLSRFARRHRGAIGMGLAATIGVLASLGLALWQAQRAESAAVAAAAEAARADAEAVEARAQAARADDAARFLLSVFRQIDPFRRDARGKISLEQAFEDALARIDREFGGRPQVAIDLNDDFGETLANLGRFDEARTRLQRALSLAEAQLRPGDPRLAETLINLGALAAQTSNARDGRPMVERALALLEPLADREPVRLANAKLALGAILLEEGDPAAAEPLVRTGHALYRLHLPDDDLRQAEAAFALAMLLRHQRKDAEAKPLIEEAVARAEALQGAEAATLIGYLDAQRANANVLLDPKRERAAVARMLEVARANFPGDHPLHADALVAVGTIKLRDFGDDEGERQLREAAAMYRRLGHPLEARAWRMIGWTRNFWERYDLALAALDAGRARCRDIGPAEAECLSIAAERVTSLVRLGRGADAIAASAELDRVIEAHGALGMDTREMADEARAEALVAGGRAADALPVFDRLIEVYIARYGTQSSIVDGLRQRRDEVARGLGPD